MIMIVQELFALSRVRRRPPANLFRASAEEQDHAPGRSASPRGPWDLDGRSH